MRKTVKIAIAMGDPAGIGPEITARALKGAGRFKDAVFFVAGDAYVLARYGFKKSGNVFLTDLKNITPHAFKPGSPTEETARASLEYLKSAVSQIKEAQAHCLVTAPLSKECVRRAGFPWPGHTEFLAHSFGVSRPEMVFISDVLKVVLVTRHMSLRDAIKSITETKIVRCGEQVLDLLAGKFKIKNPRIAVCGLNPHAGEAGLFGSEEKASIAPAIKKLNKAAGPHFFGPFAADTVFHRARHGEFDLVMAMYHDQGLIPFKMIAFESGVNLTIGLPFVRTSPVHGTAFDIAGKEVADPRSMKAAITLAYQLTKNSFK